MGGDKNKEVRKKVKTACKPFPQRGFGPLHSLGIFGRSNDRALETAELLLEFKAEVGRWLVTQCRVGLVEGALGFRVAAGCFKKNVAFYFLDWVMFNGLFRGF